MITWENWIMKHLSCVIDDMESLESFKQCDNVIEIIFWSENSDGNVEDGLGLRWAWIEAGREVTSLLQWRVKIEAWTKAVIMEMER